MMESLRVGLGYDIHRLVKNRELILGGINIPHHSGLEGESDADVLIHAVIDALLGASGLGDIGKHFPPGRNHYTGVSSIKLLQEIRIKLQEKNIKIVNIDTTIVLEEPRLCDFIGQMKFKVADTLQVSIDQINIKATTNQKIGPIGNMDAIIALAVALVTVSG